MLSINNITRHFFILISFLSMSCSNNSENILEDKVYHKLGEQIEYALKNDKLDFIKQRYNLNPTYDKLIAELNSLNIDTKHFNKGRTVKKQLILNHFDEFLKLIQQEINNGAKCEFIRYYKKENPILLFGLVGNKNYELIEFELVTQGDNTNIIDSFLIYRGLKISEYYIFDEVNKAYFGRLGGAYLQAKEELYNASGYLKKNQPEFALRAFDRIPKEFASHQHFHSIKQQIAAQLSDSLYMVTLNEKIGYNWDKASTRYLNLSEFYSRTRKSDTALIYMDSLKFFVGENFVIDSIEANLNQ